MRPSSLGGGRIMRRTLSVRLSVCPSVPLSLPSVTSRHLANYSDTHVLFGTRWGLHIVRPSRPHRFLFIFNLRLWAGRPWACRVQTLCHGLCLVWTVPADPQHRRAPSTALSDSRWSWRPKMSTIYIRQTGLLLRWPSSSMELYILPDCLKNSTLTIKQFRRNLFSSY